MYNIDKKLTLNSDLEVSHKTFIPLSFHMFQVSTSSTAAASADCDDDMDAVISYTKHGNHCLSHTPHHKHYEIASRNT